MNQKSNPHAPAEKAAQASPRVTLVARSKLPLAVDHEALALCYCDEGDKNTSRNSSKSEILAIKIGPDTEASQTKIPLVRIHSSCQTGDLLGSMRCDCGQQLKLSQELLAKEGGYLIYLPQEGRGIGLTNKMRAYELQDQGEDTYSANEKLGLPNDARDYSQAIAVLLDLGIRKLRLLTNNPKKIAALRAAGIAVERVALEIKANPFNKNYLASKRQKGGHLLSE